MNNIVINNSLLYLNIDEIIKKINKNIELKKGFIEFLYKKFNNVKKKIEPLNISKLLTFVPLPTKLRINHYKKMYKEKKNHYIFQGNPGNRILATDICIPHPSISPIPFNFGYVCNNEYRIITSNFYYYELSIDKKQYRQPWNSQCISIGFGSILNLLGSKQVGWNNNSIGIHSDDGRYFYCSPKGKEYMGGFGPGDTIGAGLIYISKDKYKPFFSLNGILCQELKEIILKGRLIPQIGYDYSHGISVNFGNKPFKLKVKKILSPNTVISTNNYFINNSFDIGDSYYYKSLYSIFKKNKINIKYNNYVNNNYVDSDETDDSQNENNISEYVPLSLTNNILFANNNSEINEIIPEINENIHEINEIIPEINENIPEIYENIPIDTISISPININQVQTDIITTTLDNIVSNVSYNNSTQMGTSLVNIFNIQNNNIQNNNIQNNNIIQNQNFVDINYLSDDE
jgi:hypothetical protein